MILANEESEADMLFGGRDSDNEEEKFHFKT